MRTDWKEGWSVIDNAATCPECGNDRKYAQRGLAGNEERASDCLHACDAFIVYAESTCFVRKQTIHRICTWLAWYELVQRCESLDALFRLANGVSQNCFRARILRLDKFNRLRNSIRVNYRLILKLKMTFLFMVCSSPSGWEMFTRMRIKLSVAC